MPSRYLSYDSAGLELDGRVSVFAALSRWWHAMIRRVRTFLRQTFCRHEWTRVRATSQGRLYVECSLCSHKSHGSEPYRIIR